MICVHLKSLKGRWRIMCRLFYVIIALGIADRKSRFFIWRNYHGNQKNDAQKQAKQQAV